MKKTNDQILKDVLQQMIQSNQWENRLDKVKLRSTWEQLMGDTVAKYTKHITLRNKTLVLLIESAPLKQELSFAKSKIIQLINEEFGKELIKEVIIH